MRVRYSTIVVLAALLCAGGLWLWPTDRVVADSMSGGGVSSSGSQPWIGNHNNMPRQNLSPVGTVFTPPTSFGNFWILNNAAGQSIACPPDIADGDSMNVHIQYGAGAPYSPALSFSSPCYGWTTGVQPTWSEAPTQSDSAFCQSMNPPDVSGVSFVCGSQLNVTPPAGTVSFPLDGLPTPAFAYSLRRLLTAYHGAAINVRRAAGSPTTTDIGFNSSGDFDAATFSTFCAGTTCFLSSTGFYDQSGNGFNCGQATAANQPQVTLASLGGRASLQTTGFAGKMYCQAPTNSALDFTGSGHSVFYVLQYTATNDGGGTGGGRGDALEVVSHYNSSSFFGWAADAGDTGRVGKAFVFTLSSGGGTGGGTTSAAINDGNPHFAGWTFTGGTVNITQDTNTVVLTGFQTPGSSGQPMTVLAGGDTPVDNFFSGNLAEIYGWSSGLSSTQVSNLSSNARTYY